jgi:hypothetical protein
MNFSFILVFLFRPAFLVFFCGVLNLAYWRCPWIGTVFTFSPNLWRVSMLYTCTDTFLYPMGIRTFHISLHYLEVCYKTKSLLYFIHIYILAFFLISFLLPKPTSCGYPAVLVFRPTITTSILRPIFKVTSLSLLFPSLLFPNIPFSIFLGLHRKWLFCEV